MGFIPDWRQKQQILYLYQQKQQQQYQQKIQQQFDLSLIINKDNLKELPCIKRNILNLFSKDIPNQQEQKESSEETNLFSTVHLKEIKLILNKILFWF